MKLMSHLDSGLDSLVGVLMRSGKVRLAAYAICKFVRLAAPGGELKFISGSCDPNVSHWTTKTPKTTVNLLTLNSET